MSFIVAIDGPAGTGKGTVTSRISKKLGLVNIDTGATYRCVTLAMLNEKIQLDELEEIKKLLEKIKIEIKNENGESLVFLDGVDVTEEIRSKAVSEMVSKVSAIKAVRYKMVELQRELAKNKDVIMEGRDIGTYVFPNADVKIYLDATIEERANRRYKQNKEKGIDMSYEEVLKNISMRDKQDKEKEMGALKVAEDSTVIDTTDISIEEVQERIEKIIAEKRNIQKPNNEKLDKKSNNKDSKWKIIQRETVRHILKFLYRVVYRVKVQGSDNIPNEGSFILCGNHVSFIKVPVIVLFTKRKVNFIAKAELFKNPILAWLGGLFDVIPVKRGKQDVDSMKKSLKVLNSGEVLGLFPEGTTHGLQKKVKVKNGASYMALRTGKPVVPVGIKVTKGPFPKIILNYGKPLDYSKYKSKIPEKEILEKTTVEIMDNIIRLTNEAV